MKKSKYIMLLTTIFMVFPLISSNAQSKNESSVEKIYTQTDRPFYFPGETIWYKSYIVDADNTISTLSDIMYAELISPTGNVIKRVKLSIKQGYAYGDFYIDEDWVGGIYSIKMFTNWMRNYGEESFFTKKITVQKIVKPNVLLSLKFEKESYGKSSKVIANFEAKDLKNNPLKNTEVRYTISVKGEIINTQKTTTNLQGKAAIHFQLPTHLKTRDVTLNVLVTHKKSTESIARSVPIALDTIDLQFFPESGKLIAKTKNRVAFKAINEFGKPVDVQGDIIDTHGTIVTTFNSFHNGMGAFELHSKTNEQYYAKIKVPFVSEIKISLPKIHTKGVHFNVTTDSLTTKLKIHSRYNKSLFLEVFNAHKTLLKEEITKNEIEINSSTFPIGITNFRLVDKNKNPIAERIVFINAHKQLNIDIQLDKEIYQTREKVKVTITTKDKNNIPIPSNLSVAIADNKLLSFADDKQDHILSYLLLSSELKGKIYKPNFYFNPEEEKSYLALDYIMLTHGWRDYIYNPIIIEAAKYKPEQLTTKSGRVLDRKGKPVKAQLLLFDQNGDKVLVFESDENGCFSFKFDKGHYLTLIAYTEDGKKLTIIGDKKNLNYTNSNDYLKREKEKSFKVKSSNPSKLNKPTNKVTKKNVTASLSSISSLLVEDSSMLDEIVVVGYGTMAKRNLSGSIVRINSEDISSEESVSQLLQGRVAGLQIVENRGIYGSSSRINIRGISSISGNNEPLIIIDGVPYKQDVLSNFNTDEINNITVLKNTAATSLYGSAASNGVIVIVTKSENYFNNWRKKKLNNGKYNNYTIKTFYNNQPSGLYNAKQFYIPKYDNKKIPKERTDFRQTVYWNPVVQTNENGKAAIEFYNSDAITSFNITTEGIGYNGLVGRQKKVYATKKLLNLDFKMPNYMVLNDTINLPVTITNETSKRIEGNLELNISKHLKLLEAFDNIISVEANSSIVQIIKVIPIEKADKTLIYMNLKAGNFSDAVKKEATILSPYFPTEVSISGSKSQQFNCSVDNLVANSLKAEFTIYTDIVGDVMDGIEGIIREPYGCFEQVSSSTYPNILVLKYLKETNKSNPEIEKRALNFIKKGYKKLAAYETSKDGFEWYGKSPPHEALTAYGLMEFTEMKEVYNGVSEPMLKRTIAYLLSRRNGKGGFHQNRGKYGFSAAPENVNNAYIVYAISESKIEVNIEKEYKNSYNEALKSNDSYRMAIMACASFNLNKMENAQRLISKIKENIANYNFSNLPVDNTITRSYGNAKNIETVAFTLLALLKEKKSDEFLISKGVEYLVGKRKHNRFGSTQSTAMALKVLIEYTKNQKTKLITQNASLEVTINGQKIKTPLNSSKNGKIVFNNLASYIKKGKQDIQVQFSNPDINFPYSLNITYDSFLPNSSKKSPLKLETVIPQKTYKVGDNVSMTVNITNKKNENLGMVTTIIGIPSGTTAQSWQLKELIAQNKAAYYEVFDNYLVFYWRSFRANETKTIRLDLKADIAGSYQAPSSTAYLYYGDEFKTWISGNLLKIDD